MPGKKTNLINILLIVSLVPAASFLVKDYIVARHGTGDAAPVRLAPAAPAAGSALTDYAPVIETGTFPSPVRSLTPLVALERPAALTQAATGGALLKGLELIGTYVGPVSFAVISNTTERVEESFQVGDVVFGSGTLKEVMRDRVAILSGAGVVTLSLKEVVIPPAPPVGSPAARRRPAPGSGARTAPSGNTLQYSVKTGDNQWAIDRKAVLNALGDMSKVLSDARMTPIFTEGRPEGFRVTEIKPRGVFDAIGLKNGDILKRVNGYEVTTPEKAVQVLTALKGQRSIDLDVVRNGSRMSFHYDIN